MKKINSQAFFAMLSFGLLVSLVGCNKVLEDGPLENVDKELVFDPKDSLGVYAIQFLNNIYSDLPRGFNRISTNIPGSNVIGNDAGVGNLLDAGSDDALPSGVNEEAQYFSNGMFNTFNLPDNVWDSNYKAIRKVNIFLRNVDIVPFKEIGLKDRLVAEAHLLRAIFYFELAKRWGGVPILGDALYDFGDNYQLPRATFDEVKTYILSEIERSYEKLYTPNGDAQNGVLGVNFGRVNKGAAMALKARVLLYAASPLHNTNNDMGRWKEAALAAKALIDSAESRKFIYALSSAAPSTPYSSEQMAVFGSSTTLNQQVNKFLNIFTTRTNNELILTYTRDLTSDVETNNGPVGSTRGDKGKTNPTQQLVDAFEMNNGKSIADESSGYDRDNPYYNRDPRLLATVFVQNLPWLGRKIQVQDGGIDRPSGYGNVNSGETRTGYYMRKFLADNNNDKATTSTNHNFPIFRYAEVLLNYAEALNEYVGPVSDVYTYMNKVRARVGMPNLAQNLTKIQMRERIRNERRAELAFEEHRFFDIRRWNIAKDVLNGTLQGIQITVENGNVTKYSVVPVALAKFDGTKMNLYPIPFKELSANQNMKQNPNW